MSQNYGIICDVGHVITNISIMNYILKYHRPTTKELVLYDDELLRDASDALLDEWVSVVCKIKINSLQSLSLKELSPTLAKIPLTTGLSALTTYANSIDIPVAFVGAVPRLFTAMLLEINDIVADAVYGSELELLDDHIQGAKAIVVPSEKRRIADLWMKQKSIDKNRCFIIGDSIGDVPMMSLVPKQCRIGFNANSLKVRDVVERAYSDSMYPVVDFIANSINNHTN